MNSPYSSTLLENAVNEFAKLPGIGRKTALRLVLHLLRQDDSLVEDFARALVTLKQEIKYCNCCHNISDSEVCNICSDKSRDASTICVVENIREVMAIENTIQFKGLYHVLGGIISPIDGIGPSDLQIAGLEERVRSGEVREVILALSATMEGEKVTGRTLEFGPVTSVIRGAAGTDFQVGTLGIFKYNDIKQIL